MFPYMAALPQWSCSGQRWVLCLNCLQIPLAMIITLNSIAVTVQGEKKDLLFFTTERYKFCVLYWDAESRPKCFPI